MNLESKRWIYLVLGTVINFILGQTYAWSVFVLPLSQKFNWSLADVSVAFAIFHSISFIPILIAGKLQERLQPKYILIIGGITYGAGMVGVGYAHTLTQLYLSYGVVGGCSMGFVYAGVVPNLVRFFPDRRGLVSGILAAGVGCAALFWAPVSVQMIKGYGVLSTFKMLGAFYVVALFVLGALMKTAPAGFTPLGWQPSEKAQQTLNVPDKNWRDLLRDPLYYLLAGMVLVGGISGMIIIAHASPILQSVGGYSAAVAGSFVGILALCNSVGRVGWGVISDRFGRMSTMIVIYVFLGGAMFWLASTPIAVLAPVLIAGMAFGGFMGQLASLAADAFGSKYLPINFGMMFVPFAIAAMIGPRLAGSIKVSTGSYTNAFFIASILCLVGIGIGVIARKAMQTRMNESMGMAGQESNNVISQQA